MVATHLAKGPISYIICIYHINLGICQCALAPDVWSRMGAGAGTDSLERCRINFDYISK